MALIGGLHYFLGPLFGAVIYIFAHDYLVANTHAWKLILGVTLLLIVLFAPDGLLGMWRGHRSAGGGWQRWKAVMLPQRWQNNE